MLTSIVFIPRITIQIYFYIKSYQRSFSVNAGKKSTAKNNNLYEIYRIYATVDVLTTQISKLKYKKNIYKIKPKVMHDLSIGQ